MVLTVVCIFLPLSAIWAGVANDSAIAFRGHDAHHRLMNSQFGRGSAAAATNDSTTAFDKSRQISCSTCTYGKKGDEFDTPELSPTGKRSFGDGIHVGRDFAVRHDTIALEHV